MCSNPDSISKPPLCNSQPQGRANEESTNHCSVPHESLRKRRRRNISQVLNGFEYAYVPIDNNSSEALKLIQCKHQGCGKLFMKSWNFLDHARTHRGIKPYECRYCKRRYTQKGNMLKHQKQHTVKDLEARKVFRCHICNKGYTENFNLRVSKVSSFFNIFQMAFLSLTNHDNLKFNYTKIIEQRLNILIRKG